MEFLALVKDVSGSITVVSKEKVGSCVGPFKVLISEEMDVNTVGFLAKVSSALAKASVPIMVYASYERDYILVPLSSFENAVRALEEASFSVRS